MPRPGRGRARPSSPQANEQTQVKQAIRIFGTEDFDLGEYLKAKYAKESFSSASMHRDVLLRREELVKDSLKSFVVDEYRKFIEISDEVTELEDEITRISNGLNEYSSIVKTLKGVSLDLTLPKYEDEETQLQAEARRRASTILQPLELHKSPTAHEDLQALEELCEELGGLVFERKFEQAVTVVENGVDRMLEEVDPLVAKAARREVDSRIEEFVQVLFTELQALGATNEAYRKRVLGWLVRLGDADAAMGAFLDHKSQLIKAKAGKIVLQDSLPTYIAELSQVVFSGIGATCREFRAVFDGRPDMLSGLVVWALGESRGFAAVFHRHVFQSAPPISVVRLCVKHAYKQCRHLEKHGLQLWPLLARLFAPPLQEMVRSKEGEAEPGLPAAASRLTQRSARPSVMVGQSISAAPTATPNPGGAASHEMQIEGASEY